MEHEASCAEGIRGTLHPTGQKDFCFFSYILLLLFALIFLSFTESLYSVLSMLSMLHTTVHLCKLLKAVIEIDFSSSIDVSMTQE